jgi:hypothetical protein
MLQSQTFNDRLIVGDSGAGYINPTQLLPPRSPSNYRSAADMWIDYNRDLYQLFDQRFSGFLLNGQSGKMTPQAELLYQSFSGRGVVDELGALGADGNHMDDGNLVVLVQQDFAKNGDVQSSAQEMLAKFDVTNPKPQFFVWRSVLQQPQFYANVVAAVHALPGGENVAVVEPLVLSYLARSALGGSNSQLVTYVQDSFPEGVLACSSTVDFAAAIRNDGWDTVYGNNSLCAVMSGGGSPSCAALGQDIGEGETVVVDVSVQTPAISGSARVEFGLVNATGRSFTDWGNANIRYNVEVRC